MWSIWEYWGYLKHKNYTLWAEETVTIFCPSLVISHQFLTISALENNNWASVLGPFKGLFLPMALQNHMTAGSDERLTFSFGTHTRTQSSSGITSCETPLELYQTDWTCIKGCDFTHETLAYIMTMFPAACSVTPPPTSPVLPTLHSAEQLG